MNFIRRYYVLILFLILESIAINYYARSSSYTRAKIITTANEITKGINSALGSAENYLSLAKNNEVLVERIAELENELTEYRSREADTLGAENKATLARFAENMPYEYYTAKVIYNTITGQNNYFVINKGVRDGIEPNMAIMTVDGRVVGYVEMCTEDLSACMSIINRDFRLGGQIKGRDFFGSIRWDGINHRTVKLTEMPRYAEVNIGDSVVSVYSQRFPPNSFIGTVKRIDYSEDNTFYEIDVELAADLAKIKAVLVVRYEESEELDVLLNDLHY